MIVLLTLMLSGCNGCQTKKTAPVASAPESTQEAGASFVVDLAQIFATGSHFIYRSDLVITSKIGNNKEEDYEAIEIYGAHPRLRLKKKIDPHHFFEIIADGNAYLVSNQGRDFRKGADNQPMYGAIVHDSLNLLNFLVDQFGLKERLQISNSSNGKRDFVFNGPLEKSAPFLVQLATKVPAFSEMANSDVHISFSVDEKTGLPLVGSCTCTITGSQDRSMVVKASFSLERKSQGEAIALPNIKEDVLESFPVDIGRRFNEIMGEKESK